MQPFRSDLLAGKVALITGGGTGLGWAMAEMFARLGAAVAVASRSEERVGEAAARLRSLGPALGVQCDVRDPESVHRAVGATCAELGRLDILVNNAAGNFLVRAENLSPNGWAAVRSIVLDGTFLCSRAVFPVMQQQGCGSILNVVATYAESAGAFVVHSAAAKAGVVSLTRTMAVEWAAHGIRVNAISPGPVETKGAGGQLWNAPEARAAIEQAVPLRRFGSAEEVATMAAFLVSDAASYCTGGVYPVDGGLTLGQGLFDSRFAGLLRD